MSSVLPFLTVPTGSPAPLPRAWYGGTLGEFFSSSPASILGHLAGNSSSEVTVTQRGAWVYQIQFLQRTLPHLRPLSPERLEGAIFFEFNIPRMGRRIDVVVLLGAVVLVLEFKVGEKKFERSARDQVWDYALDLKNFHEASHGACIVPVLIPTETTEHPVLHLQPDEDQVYRPISVHPADFPAAVATIYRAVTGMPIDLAAWPSAPYRPTPTILEAARALYAQHSVHEIQAYDASKRNLAITSRRLEELVDGARAGGRKILCFVTGVPGAGKTLVGLNLATRRRETTQPTHAVFLSGNAPLVAVLREALTRDEVARRKAQGVSATKNKVGESVKAFIQNVHHFRDEALIDSARPPADHVVIFDEAQRAWNLHQTAHFMRRKKNRPDFSASEPEFLISYMDRHPDWAVIVCLVGGGQEINTGEAGIEAWIDAVRTRFRHWDMHISSRLTDSEYAAGAAIEQARAHARTLMDDALHLAVSMRSFRAENVSAFVKALLDRDVAEARAAYRQLASRFPLVVTRSLPAAKGWIRARARGTERYGLVASSKAQRLKPHAVDIRVEVNPIHYFLNSAEDTRSSYYLEDAATEFQVQGLELDWVCVTWDADLRLTPSGWSYHDFRGDKWTTIHNVENRRYLKNAYRVLLTRARQGMVIFVPEGDANDPTRAPSYYDATYDFLRSLGVTEVPA